MEREEARSVALRAFIGKRQAAASSTDLSAKGLQDSGRAHRRDGQGRAGGQVLRPARCALSRPRRQRPTSNNPTPRGPTPEQLLELAQALRSGFARHSRHRQFRRRRRVERSLDIRLRDLERLRRRGELAPPTASARSRSPRRTTRWSATMSGAPSASSPTCPRAEEIGRIAGERTARRLGATQGRQPEGAR